MDILQTVERLPEKCENLIMLGVFIALFALVMIFFTIVNQEHPFKRIFTYFAVGALSLVMYVGMKMAWDNALQRETIVYATIQDDCNWKDIYENYELIDVLAGVIYRLRER